MDERPAVSPTGARLPLMPPATLMRWANRGESAYVVERGKHRRVSPPELRALLCARFR